MSTEYAGNNVYPATITVPSDGDLDAAAAYAVAMEQLADRTAYLSAIISGGMSLSFTNATFHGVTTFADGSLQGTLTNPSSLSFGHFFHVTAADNASFVSAMMLALGGDSIEVTAATAVQIVASSTSMFMDGTGMTINGGNGITLNVDAAHAAMVTGGAGSIFDVFAGRFIVDTAAGSITLGVADVTLGDGAGATVTSLGHFVANLTSTLTGAVTMSSSASVATGLTVAAGGLVVAGGKFRVPAVEPTFGLGMSADHANNYEFIFSNAMTSDTTVSLNHSLVNIGQRVRFNAQKVTGAYTYYVQTGDGREWAMRNNAALGSTVILEFVSDGTQWIVDDWATYNAARNGI